MNIEFEITRRKSAADAPYISSIRLEADEHMTVAQALDIINDPIRWECSCKQKKCGACAMLINGKPRLACDTELSVNIRGRIRLAPLGKFPAVCDLVVDRSVMYGNLRQLGAWLENDAQGISSDTSYDASRCLQCGCCLEICPNFYSGGEFFGTAALVPASRLIEVSDAEDRSRTGGAYEKHIYKGCGKSLACRDVCPAGIDIDSLLVRSNAAAVWKRKPRKKK